MFVDVPLPVWKTSRGKWASSLPSMTSWQAWTIAFPIFESRRPSSMFVWAAAILIRPSAEEAPTEADPADREIFDGPLRLGAPVGVLGDFQFTQEVLLDAVVGHARCVRTERGEH